MKIAIPLDENKTNVCSVLSRAPFFLFWEDGKETVMVNPAAQAQAAQAYRRHSILWTTRSLF